MTTAELAEARVEEAEGAPILPSLSQIHPEEMLAEIPEYKPAAKKVAGGLHKLVLKGGQPARFAADALHGTWLGHPLHAVLTDVTVGAWVIGSLMDVLSLGRRKRVFNQHAADTLIALGTAAAVPTALSGLTDYSTIPQGVVTTGATHGLINVAALALYTGSVGLRKAGQRLPAMLLSAVGLGLVTVSSWLGGHLSYHYLVGVNRAEAPGKPKPWAAVADDDDLAEGKPMLVEVNEKPVLLYRCQGEILAIGAVCSHEAGPLEEGKFDGCQVECPWHQSVFDLRSGRVVHGPATNPEPVYKTRVRQGKVELRLKD